MDEEQTVDSDQLATLFSKEGIDFLNKMLNEPILLT